MLWKELKFNQFEKLSWAVIRMAKIHFLPCIYESFATQWKLLFLATASNRKFTRVLLNYANTWLQFEPHHWCWKARTMLNIKLINDWCSVMD
jgi:hypothetical protein